MSKDLCSGSSDLCCAASKRLSTCSMARYLVLTQHLPFYVWVYPAVQDEPFACSKGSHTLNGYYVHMTMTLMPLHFKEH